jgi:hypothetical protein
MIFGMDQLHKLIQSQWMPMLWEHHLQLIMNLIVGTAMALPRCYQRVSLISMKSLSAHFQLLEVCTQDEVERFWGSRGLAINHLVLE